MELPEGFVPPPPPPPGMPGMPMPGGQGMQPLADGTMPSTKDFVLKFTPIVSPEPYVQIYAEDVGDDMYLYGLVNPQIKRADLRLADKSSITILADVSGSMSGTSLRQMQSVLTNFI